MNVVILMGRLTREPEIRYSQGENTTAIAHYSLAVDRRFKRDGQPDADFFDCVCFGRSAEFAEKYLHKGTKIAITGRLQNDNYQGKDGQMVYRNNVVVENQEFAESKSASQSNGSYMAPQQAAPAPRAAAAPAPRHEAPAPDTAGDGFMNIPDGIDEELPFS
ncbi:MAG TPA: single-stranded DNA-binding protein [Lachnospiraceae bacterium]|nr:single-stranded DNA-binding protein [Lachnospiraceae bacterium]